MVSQGSGKNPGQPIFSRLWGSGFLPSSHQGVGLRARRQSGALPAKIRRGRIASTAARCSTISPTSITCARARLGDPETLARINAYEMAFRMQTSVPELTDTSDESPETLASYGPEVAKRGNATRRTASSPGGCSERDVRFVQLFHRGWDQHIADRRSSCRTSAKTSINRRRARSKTCGKRGLLDDTLVVFATRVRPHGLQPGATRRPAAWAATTTAAASPCGSPAPA